jgi:hypothetical protein
LSLITETYFEGLDAHTTPDICDLRSDISGPIVLTV